MNLSHITIDQANDDTNMTIDMQAVYMLKNKTIKSTRFYTQYDAHFPRWSLKRTVEIDWLHRIDQGNYDSSMKFDMSSRPGMGSIANTSNQADNPKLNGSIPNIGRWGVGDYLTTSY